MSRGRRLQVPAAFRLLLPLSALCLPAQSHGQLASAVWTESATASTGTTTGAQTGVDDALPEAVSATLSGEAWSADAEILYGPPGPPEVTCAASGYYFSGSPPALSAYCTGTIAFEVQVRQTGNPPGPVTWVPISWIAHLAVDVEGGGGFSAGATVGFSLVQDPTVLVDTLTTASLMGSTSEAVHVAMTRLVHPEVPIEGYMYGVASIGAELLQPGTSASATAYLDPTFEVADELIPGTSVNFRDYFDIEYGDGFWALGNTPIEKTTWGRIKSLY